MIACRKEDVAQGVGVGEGEAEWGGFQSLAVGLGGDVGGGSRAALEGRHDGCAKGRD